MRRITAVVVFLLWTTLAVGVVLPGVVGAARQSAVTPYEGRIIAIRIDTCGLAPGLCEGSIVLAKNGGGKICLAIRVGTWIKRGDRFLTIQDLAVGDDVKVQTFQMGDETFRRVAILQFTTP